MSRPSIGEAPMTGANVRRAIRAAHAAGVPVVRTRRPAERRSRLRRRNDTIAAAVQLQAEYRTVRSLTPCGRLSSSISPNSRRSNRRGASGVIEQRDGPYGMGHDDAPGRGQRLPVAAASVR
jgi:hypothetical protein